MIGRGKQDASGGRREAGEERQDAGVGKREIDHPTGLYFMGGLGPRKSWHGLIRPCGSMGGQRPRKLLEIPQKASGNLPEFMGGQPPMKSALLHRFLYDF